MNNNMTHTAESIKKKERKRETLNNRKDMNNYLELSTELLFRGLNIE